MALESSTEDEGAAGAEAAAGATEDVNAAGSSPGEATNKDVSLVETIDKVLGEGQEGSSASEEDGTDKSQSEQKASGDEADGADKEKAKEQELSDEISEEEIGKFSERAQARIRQLVGVRNERDEKIAELGPKAEQMDKVLSFMETNNIQPHEFDNAMNITRVINSGDYDSAIKLVEPIYQELLQKTGRVLPDDLQERVRLGYLTQADADALHQSQAKAKNLETRAKEEREREQAEAEHKQWNDHCTAMASHADAWAKTKAQNDPDWSLKQDDLGKELELLLYKGGRDGYPKTKEDAIALAEKALETVEARLKKFQPKPKAQTVPQGDHASSGTQAEPKDLMEAIDRALAS